ncbi:MULTISPECIES: CopG family transcriptional regulator [Paenibacillus]|uniref:CopG family transcriptional regulator n=1 Tax=Paenibacillus vini TaxID=1476024 RepID=A0ABQ4MGF4_9BACL|nr:MULTISPECIES: CopG family transcriptional regulator [Paenibacillus]MBQ4901035.1 CopG family transcriptional regulator [Paenibacillus sp. Marseille-P2973]MDN4068241.1 CopG family transcriptional regulator [Paenibacillus vini]GIP54490.1 CopG family transcriptional regulator [Paenibacillus vini]
MADLEKITINVGPVDLGQIDLLVDQGFYSNRTDFIRIAIRNQIDSHSHEINQYKQEKYFVFGVAEFNRSELEDLKSLGKRLNVKLVGALVISSDVTLELAKETFEKVKVFGMIRGPEPVKKWLRELQQES